MIFHLTRPRRHNTLLCLTTVRPILSQLPKCPILFPNQLHLSPTPPTFSHLSLKLVLKQLTNTMASFIKVSYPRQQRVFIGSAKSLILTRRMKTGVSTFLFCLLHGRTSAPTVFFFLSISRRCSSTCYHPQTSSVPKHSKGNAHSLSLLLWRPPTLIEWYGLIVSMKKSLAFNLRTPTSKLASPNIKPSKLKGPLAQSL
jgi:hypothetical protein